MSDAATFEAMRLTFTLPSALFEGRQSGIDLCPGDCRAHPTLMRRFDHRWIIQAARLDIDRFGMLRRGGKQRRAAIAAKTARQFDSALAAILEALGATANDPEPRGLHHHADPERAPRATATIVAVAVAGGPDRSGILIRNRPAETVTRDQFAHPWGLNTRSVEPGNLASFAAGLRGRATSSPPQFGHFPLRTVVAQPRQKVHSKEQITASFASGGRSRLQHSQLGRSCSMLRSFVYEPSIGVFRDDDSARQ